VLSEADVSFLTHLHCTTISHHVLKYERETGESLPRRGTIHDLGGDMSEG
jgi:hypothetical protein